MNRGFSSFLILSFYMSLPVSSADLVTGTTISYLSSGHLGAAIY